MGALAGSDPNFRHEYPHCWRCKNPVIFRATVQWFVRLDDPATDVRAESLAAIGARARGRRPGARPASLGMVENRHEWVISRQRRWGSPITLLYATKAGERAGVYPWSDSPAEQAQVSSSTWPRIFRDEGADAWYARPAADFLPPGADLRGFARETSRRRPTSSTSGSTRASRTWPSSARENGPSSPSPAAGPPTSMSRGTTSTAAGSSRRS